MGNVIVGYNLLVGSDDCRGMLVEWSRHQKRCIVAEKLVEPATIRWTYTGGISTLHNAKAARIHNLFFRDIRTFLQLKIPTSK